MCYFSRFQNQFLCHSRSTACLPIFGYFSFLIYRIFSRTSPPIFSFPLFPLFFKMLPLPVSSHLYAYYVSYSISITWAPSLPPSSLPLLSWCPSCRSLLSGLVCDTVLLTWLVSLKGGGDRLLTWHPCRGREGEYDRRPLVGWCYTVRGWWRRWWRWGDDKVEAWTQEAVWRGLVVSNRRQGVNAGFPLLLTWRSPEKLMVKLWLSIDNLKTQIVGLPSFLLALMVSFRFLLMLN